ncbi:alpha/beta fold hydrolase [Zhongshania guokunii]|uniref:Alpha/beta fold hydrolase n=1 Tax=Zhongshania guokunii TaxID=641783 RepID=A0ABV3U3Z5_9GAMM
MEIKSNTLMRSPPADYFPAKSDSWFVLKDGYDAEKTLFYYDYVSGPGEPVATVLMVHGNPECSYTYRHIRDHLIKSAGTFRIIAMDHIGFGLSDAADFEMVDMHHAANVLQLVRHLELEDITLLVHDWGGPIGIGALLNDHWRVKNLVVMNTTVFPMSSSGFTYQNYPITWFPWCRVPHFIPNFLWGGVAGYVVSHAEPQSNATFFCGVIGSILKFRFRRFAKGSPEYVWSEVLRSPSNVKSSKRNVLQTPVWGHGYQYHDPTHGIQDNHGFYTFIQREILAQWGAAGRNIPICGYFGKWDPCGKDEVIAQWQQALPQMKQRTHEFPEVGHFIEETKGEEIAEGIIAMVNEK